MAFGFYIYDLNVHYYGFGSEIVFFLAPLADIFLCSAFVFGNRRVSFQPDQYQPISFHDIADSYFFV